MKWFNASRIKVAVFAAVVGLVVGTTVKADFTFGDPVNLGPTINSFSHDVHPCISADGLFLYFASWNREGGYGDGDIWVSTRESTNNEWTVPENLGPLVNSAADEFQPAISTDGLELYFVRFEGGDADSAIWVTRRATRTEPWGDPVELDLIADSANEWDPSLSADGLELYFDFNVSGISSPSEICVTTRETRDSPWGVPVNLGPLVNSWSQQTHPRISSDGLLLLFGDDFFLPPYRPGGFGGSDIWCTRRAAKDSAWGEPVNLGSPINGVFHDEAGMISPDGSTLYFDSSRPGSLGAQDLWQAPILPVVDFDDNGTVDMNDLLTMIEYLGTGEPMCDIGPMPWGDGVVDEADLGVLMDYWGHDVNPPIDPIAHWTLDETDGLRAHDCMGDNDGTLTGGPLWQPAAGTIDGALALDGVDDYVVIDRILNPLHGPFSVFAWIKGGEPGQVIVSQQPGANWLMADASEGRLMTELGATADGSELVSETTITDGNWHRVGFTWDASTRRLYVDDVLVAEDPQTGLASSYGRHYIGCGKDMSPGSFFSGLIDDVRIYNRAVRP